MSFERAHFDDFSNSLLINSKEEGVIPLGKSLLGTQKRWLQEVEIGMAEGVREFVTLKCRQIGISTISLAFDLYWPFSIKGMTGAIVVHDESARDSFRATLDMYYDGLPQSWKIGVVQHNRNQLVLANGSGLQYKVAGVKETSKKSLGRSSALMFLHATEVAFWGDPNQVYSLKGTLAEKNPNRLYHWETTANSFNFFYDMWEEAKAAVTQRAIFISWWANEYYRVARDSQVFRMYWGARGRPSKDELEWLPYVKKVYGYDITPEQLAWWRWMRAEKVTDEAAAMAEFPPTEEHAFQATGSQFFSIKNLTDAFKRIALEPKAASYRFQFGKEFHETEIISPKKESDTQLLIWEEPVKGAFYTIGADPAYGWSENSNGFVVQVNRAYANRLEQVAEFRTEGITTYAFAWVIVYLAGAYEPSILNLELNGPGEAVLNEIQNLKKTASLKHVSIRPGMLNVVQKIQHFLYRRLDSIGGIPTAIHTLSNERLKDSMFSTYRDYFERDILVPHSKSLLSEMREVRRPADGGAPRAESGHDDRVIGEVLACRAWNDQLRTRLIAQNVTWIPPEERPQNEVIVSDTVLGRSLRNYLVDIGVRTPVVRDTRGTRMGVPRK